MGDLVWILVSSLVVNNFTLNQFLGICPFLGVSGRIDTALRLGIANTFVLVMTSVSVSALNALVLDSVPFLRVIAFIIVIACLVQFVEMVIKKTSPALFRALGIYLPLITTNCAILALAVLQTARQYTFVQGIFFALGGGGGLTIALVLMASLREETGLSAVPDLVRGTALTLILAGCLSLAFMGFGGLFSAQ
jgi:electron transport complex protein RnfA